MKKVMFYCHVFYPQNGGYSNAFQNLIHAILDNEGDIHITVMTPYPLREGVAELQRDRLEVFRLKPKTNIRRVQYFLNAFFYAKAVSQKFKSGRFDFLLIETFDQALFINFLDKDIYNKTAVRIHSTNETEHTLFASGFRYWLRRYLMQKHLLKKIRWFFSTNSFHINFFKKYYFKENLIDIGEKVFFVLPNVINTFEPDSYDVEEKIRVFCLGRMDFLGNNQKGFSDFIYAFKFLPKNISDRFEITIVGSGDMRSRLITLCKDLRNVRFLESMPHKEILQSLQKSDVVLLPSRYEGLSMFALEGLATGNLCLFSETGGLVDMVDGNGVFFEPQNIESIVSAFQVLASLGNDELVEMKRKSINVCQKKFSPKIVSDKFKFILDVVEDAQKFLV